MFLLVTPVTAPITLGMDEQILQQLHDHAKIIHGHDNVSPKSYSFRVSCDGCRLAVTGTWCGDVDELACYLVGWGKTPCAVGFSGGQPVSELKTMNLWADGLVVSEGAGKFKRVQLSLALRAHAPTPPCAAHASCHTHSLIHGGWVGRTRGGGG